MKKPLTRRIQEALDAPHKLFQTEWDEEYQDIVSKYFELVTTSDEFKDQIIRLTHIGCTTSDVYELLEPLKKFPELYKEFPAGNGPVQPITAVMSRVREYIKKLVMSY